MTNIKCNEFPLSPQPGGGGRERKKKPFPKYKKILLIIFIPWITMLTWHRVWNHPIKSYGLVLDQNDDPVPGVIVTAHIGSVNPIMDTISYVTFSPMFIWQRAVHRHTNKEGRFKITGYYGNSLNIQNISSKNNKYEYNRFAGTKNIETNPKYRDYIKPDPKNPIIYRMRKLGETTFILNGQIRDITASFDANRPQNSIAYFDIFQRTQLNQKELETMYWRGVPIARDLKISAKWEEPYNRWAITFAAGTEKGGIQISNKILYMAPETGYKPEVTFYVYFQEDKSINHVYIEEFPSEPFEPEEYLDGYRGGRYYFYLKSRDSEIYSRIKMELDSTFYSKSKLELWRMKITTNPYAGERCLDMEPNIPYELRKNLEKEIDDAFQKYPNARIPAPDLPARIRAYGGRAAGDKR